VGCEVSGFRFKIPADKVDLRRNVFKKSTLHSFTTNVSYLSLKNLPQIRQIFAEAKSLLFIVWR
jgi:hypothetical protein